MFVRHVQQVLSMGCVFAACSGGSSPTVPTCHAGQVLTGNGSQLSCIDAPPPDAALPNCAAGQELTTVSGQLVCVNDAAGDAGVSIPNCSAGQVLAAMNGQLQCVTPAVPPGAPTCAANQVLTGLSDGGTACVSVVTLPTCAPGQVLASVGGALVCTTVAAGTVLPTCTAGQALSTLGDGAVVCVASTAPPPACPAGQVLTSADGGFACVAQPDLSTLMSVTSTLQTQVATLQTQVATLQTQVAALMAAPAGGVFVGVTTTTTSGMITHAGAANGLAAAAATCSDSFAGSHMCTVEEMALSVSSGRLTSTTTINPPAWVYAPSWQTPQAGPQEPLAGVSDNCAMYTYATAHFGWRGVAVDWIVDPLTGASVLHWHGSTDAFCSGVRPIACCR